LCEPLLEILPSDGSRIARLAGRRCCRLRGELNDLIGQRALSLDGVRVPENEKKGE
jgi:hypothetical protein